MNIEPIKASKIVLVDDNATNLGVLFDYLTDFGFMVLVAQDGESAFRLIEEDIPDIILLDVRMPGMDGFEVCRQLKARDATKDIPVIFMTALSETEDKVKGFDAGGVDYITKPFQQEEVLARVKAHLTIRKLQQQLQEQNEQLQALNACKDTFFSIIAHDLRGPFNSLLGFTEVIISKIHEYSKDNIKELMIKLQGSAETLFKLLENLLTWARIQRGMIEYHPKSIDLQNIVAHNVLLFTAASDQKNIFLKTSIPEPTSVYADPNMVDTIVRNLISNGLKFTNTGGEISISVIDGEDAITVSISDTGIGIPKDRLSELFQIDVKYQRQGTAGESGSGLGLILCKELVEKNGGNIWIESEVGIGTTFKFTLPKKPGGETQN